MSEVEVKAGCFGPLEWKGVERCVLIEELYWTIFLMPVLIILRS